MSEGVDPRSILKQILPEETTLPEDLDNLTLWKIVANLVSEPPTRKKLEKYNTLEDVIQLMKTCKNIVVLTGAGVCTKHLIMNISRKAFFYTISGKSLYSSIGGNTYCKNKRERKQKLHAIAKVAENCMIQRKQRINSYSYVGRKKPTRIL